jgi:HlyD family secretion protein
VNTTARPQGRAVVVAAVGREDLQAKVTANGKVQAKKKVDISATIPGQILHLAVNEGDPVTKGQFLLQIDATNPRATARSTEFSMQALTQEQDSARATLEGARDTLSKTPCARPSTGSSPPSAWRRARWP